MQKSIVENIFYIELEKIRKFKILFEVLNNLKRKRDKTVEEWIIELERQMDELTVGTSLFWSYIKSDKIDELERAILISYFFEGQSYRKIATIVGYRSHNSVKQIIKQAIKKLS